MGDLIWYLIAWGAPVVVPLVLGFFLPDRRRAVILVGLAGSICGWLVLATHALTDDAEDEGWSAAESLAFLGLWFAVAFGVWVAAALAGSWLRRHVWPSRSG